MLKTVPLCADAVDAVAEKSVRRHFHLWKLINYQFYRNLCIGSAIGGGTFVGDGKTRDKSLDRRGEF
jgi:hypothetical protein